MDEMLKFQSFFQKLGGVGTLGINYVVCFRYFNSQVSTNVGDLFKCNVSTKLIVQDY